jgi:hypothetical protein
MTCAVASAQPQSPCKENDQLVILVGLRHQVVRAFVSFGMLSLIKSCLRFRRRLNALHYSATLVSEPKADET